MWRKHAEIVAVMCGALLLTGCLQAKSIVSTSEGNSEMTLDEQREWVVQHLDSAVTASGVSEGWHKTRKTLPWTPGDEAGVLQAVFPIECSETAGRLDVSIKNQDADDPLGATAKVREFWENEGLPVHDLYDTHHDTEPYFIVDFEDGGTFSMQASSKGMSMSVITSCSSDDTVVNWMDYEEGLENPFEDELERREDATDGS